LRKATALDWAGDPIEVEHRFSLGHGERNYKEMLEHFQDYTDIIGDHPQNLRTTILAFNAYALTHEEKYKKWALEYVDAWVERARSNPVKDVMPSNVGLDGKIGSATGGKWYGGAYGWGFSVRVPQTGRIDHRTRTESGWAGLRSAFLLTADDRYLETWRKQIDTINAARKMEDGRWVYPRMYGDNGWYAWTPQPYSAGADELYALSMRDDDRRRVGPNQWLSYLQGENADYPETALRRDLAEVRRRVAGMREDDTTPDTRLADDPMKYNPCSVTSLLQLTMAGVDPGRGGNSLVAKLRYFDAENRRPGLPEDVAALVTKLTADEAELTLVNVSQLDKKTLYIQGGPYAEHTIVSAAGSGRETPVGGPRVQVRLAPGAGARLKIRLQRHTNPPTFALPWSS
jgi:hypothetical protein